MTFGQSRAATLDAIIRKARYLLISFDGPIRSVKAGVPADSESSTAPPAPHIADVLTACGESGRFAAVVTVTPVAEVRAYLDAHDLSTQITLIAASIGEAASVLEALPADCVAITTSPSDIEAAQAIGTPSIAYAKTEDDAAHLVNTGASASVYTMMDLALKLRSLR